jgi:hypothetical protein
MRRCPNAGARREAPTQRAVVALTQRAVGHERGAPLGTSGARCWASAEWPLMYLVMLCRTMSAPRRSGGWKKSEGKVLSTSMSGREGCE